MNTMSNPITIDYVNAKTHRELHLPLSIFKKPSNQNEYGELEEVLDLLIDEVRDDENHPLAIAMQVIGDNLEDYDNAYHPPIGNNVNEIELVRYLMEENNLYQKDLTDVFGNQGNASKFLNGERKLSKSQIAKLVHKFKISAQRILLTKILVLFYTGKN